MQETHIGDRVTIAYRSPQTKGIRCVTGWVIADRWPNSAIGLDTDKGPLRIPLKTIVTIVPSGAARPKDCTCERGADHTQDAPGMSDAEVRLLIADETCRAEKRALARILQRRGTHDIVLIHDVPALVRKP